MFWREQDTGWVWFRGVLDASTAHEVRPFLSACASDTVTLDLSQATSIDYCGLTALVAEITVSECAVRLRGLRSNHIRMLRYFAVDPARFDIHDDAGDPGSG